MKQPIKQPIRKPKEFDKAIKTVKHLKDAKDSPKRIEKAMETYKAESKDFMSRFVRFALANEAYFQFLTDFFTSWGLTVKDLDSEELDNIFYAYELIQTHEEQAKALETTNKKLSGAERRIMDAFVVESYPLYIQFLEIDLMKDRDFIKKSSDSLDVFQEFLKLNPKPPLKKELEIAREKANKYKELVLASELKLASAKIKLARYTS